MILITFMNKTAWIDFWTTNTAIWYSNKLNEAKMISLNNSWSKTDRTCIFYDFENDWESTIWQNWFDECVDWVRWRLITSPKKFLKNEKLPEIQIMKDKFDLLDVISHIVSDFKMKLEKEAWGEIDSILVGRPVRFHDTDDNIDKIAEDRLKEAFKRAWFKNIEFQFEPIWAFKAYSKEHPSLTNWNHKTLVVDLWWWTSDFSLVDIKKSKIQVLWNTWVYVWWDNLDEKMVFWHFSKYLWKWSRQRLVNGWNSEIPISIFKDFSDKANLLFLKDYSDFAKRLIPLLVSEEDKISLWRLNEILWNISIWYDFHSQVEKTKIELTNKEIVQTDFNMFRDKFSSILTRDEFDEIIKDEVEKIKLSLLELISITWVKAESIDSIIMNWWTAFIPSINSMVEEIIWKWKILKWNSLSSVWYWLTLESYEKFR